MEAGDAIVSGRRVPDKIFGLLDMHDTLARALPPLRAALAAQQQSRLERASPGACRVAGSDAAVHVLAGNAVPP